MSGSCGAMCAGRPARLTAPHGAMSAAARLLVGTLYRMAQRVMIELIDDLDGSEATETVRFGLENHTFEIDLSGTNAQNLRDALQPYLTSARRVSGKTPKAAPSSATGEIGRAHV